MWLKNEDMWDGLNEQARTDRYMREVVTYAELWVNRMELAQREGDDFLVIANKVAERAAKFPEQIPIFGYATLILAEVWGQGDALRTWYQKRFKQSSDN